MEGDGSNARPAVKATTNFLQGDLIGHFGLKEIFKETKKKKENRPLAISFREIIKRELDVKLHDFKLTDTQKKLLLQN
ncbi:unnamed protein product [Blepharisma stoltei]|uniref:Uncharacterized protein n=1 Tax=Blepharisma stoltei TaxID=1481888 RepID=A0AAU9ITV7_9CILI|nr:unnamed protein product [Blepharisma stoltei]